GRKCEKGRATRHDKVRPNWGLLARRLADDLGMEILRKGWAVQSRLHAVRLYGGGEPELQRPPPCVCHQVPADPTTRFVEDRQKAEGDGCGFGRMVHGVTLESPSPWFTKPDPGCGCQSKHRTRESGAF